MRSIGLSAAGCASGSLLSVNDLSVEDVSGILSLTTELEQMPHQQRARLLAGRRIALLFYESSTRTRTSFELAAKSLGATTTLVSDKSSSIEKGESLKDTGLTLRALGAECIILRHASSGAPSLLARMTKLPVLNAGDGMHEHPSQALLDLRTMLKRLPGRDVDAVHCLQPGWCDRGYHRRYLAQPRGAIERHAVAASRRAGGAVRSAGTAAGRGAGGCPRASTIERDFDAALSGAQVVMMLRIQKERLAGLELDLGEYMARYQLNGQRLGTAGSEGGGDASGPDDPRA